MQVMDYGKEPRRDVLCVDVKSFFASVEAVERGIHPLKSNIAVVSRAETNGGLVLASAPLVKQRYGIKTGSRVFEFPKGADILKVAPQMRLYVEKNLKIIDIFKRYASDEDIHVYSIDEAFVDVTQSHGLFGSTQEIAARIQKEVWRELGLVVTIGIGDNPLLAKLALDHEAKKANTQNFIATWHYEDVQEKLWPITPLSEFWGIGSKTEKKLNRMGMHTMKDVAQYDFARMKKRFGVIGEELFFHAHGIDRTRFNETYTPKATSFSKSYVLPRDYHSLSDVDVVLREMTEEVAYRLRKRQKTTQLIRVSIGYSRHVSYAGFSHEWTIPETNSSAELVRYASRLLTKHYSEVPVRTIAVSCGRLKEQRTPFKQLDLFSDPVKQVDTVELDAVRDTLRRKFGYTALLHASSLSDAGRAQERAKLLGGHASGESDESQKVEKRPSRHF